MTDTKQRLLSAAYDVLREQGIVAVSARTIAARAGANQALIFYHFGTVTELLSAAVQAEVHGRVEAYRAEFAAVGTLGELLALGRSLHVRERESGNVAVMAQLMAGGQQDERLAVAARDALAVWSAELEVVLRRVLADSPLGLIADPAGLAAAVSASFIGLELYDGVDPASTATALDALDHLGVLEDVMDDLGPVGRRALQRQMKRRGSAR